jgi:hypothetical protein
MAFQVIQQVEQNLGNYYGFAVGELIDPQKVQMLKQLQVDGWLMFWNRVYTQMFSLSLQFMSEEEIIRITGSPLKQGMSDIHSQFDFNVRFDVRDTDPEFVQKKLEAIIKTVVPLDSGGIIDRNKLVKLVIESISPDAARELVIDQATASQKLYKDVVSDIGMMMLGNEALYTEMDPAASSKLQFAQDIMSKESEGTASPSRATESSKSCSTTTPSSCSSRLTKRRTSKSAESAFLLHPKRFRRKSGRLSHSNRPLRRPSRTQNTTINVNAALSHDVRRA